MESTSMAAISSLTTRSGKPRALTGATIRMLGHDVDGEPTRIGDFAQDRLGRRRSRRRGYFLSGRRDSMSPMLKQPDWLATSADGSGWRAKGEIAGRTGV